MRPDLTRVPSFYHGYIHHVKDEDLKSALSNNSKELFNFLGSVPATMREYRYADKKWSIKELVLHLIDAERIFAYRALRFSRQDKTPLPGFDENQYVDQARIADRSWESLIDELKSLRKANELFFESLTEEQLEFDGVSNGQSIYVRALGFIIAGHCIHHMKVMKERYLKSSAIS